VLIAEHPAARALEAPRQLGHAVISAVTQEEVYVIRAELQGKNGDAPPPRDPPEALLTSTAQGGILKYAPAILRSELKMDVRLPRNNAKNRIENLR